VLSYNQALTLAETWIRVLMGDGVQILKDQVLKKPYGWVFFYQSKKFLAGDDLEQLAGNTPILVDRINGEIRVTDTARPLNQYLADYEALLPKARLELSLPNEP
jgi:hypothetical protein